MSLIKSTIVTYTVDVPEADVRQALIFEAAGQPCHAQVLIDIANRSAA